MEAVIGLLLMLLGFSHGELIDLFNWTHFMQFWDNTFKKYSHIIFSDVFCSFNTDPCWDHIHTRIGTLKCFVSFDRQLTSIDLCCCNKVKAFSGLILQMAYLQILLLFYSISSYKDNTALTKCSTKRRNFAPVEMFCLVIAHKNILRSTYSYSPYIIIK